MTDTSVSYKWMDNVLWIGDEGYGQLVQARVPEKGNCTGKTLWEFRCCNSLDESFTVGPTDSEENARKLVEEVCEGLGKFLIEDGEDGKTSVELSIKLTERGYVLSSVMQQNGGCSGSTGGGVCLWGREVDPIEAGHRVENFVHRLAKTPKRTLYQGPRRQRKRIKKS